MLNTTGKHILSPLERCPRHLKTTSTTIKRFKFNIPEKTIWPIRNMDLKPTFLPSFMNQDKVLFKFIF